MNSDAAQQGIRNRLDEAFRALGCVPRAWRFGASTVEWQGKTFPVRVDTLASQIPIDISDAEPDELVFAISGILGIPVPDRLLADFECVRPWLRPRVVTREHLKGPERTMCRRDAFGPLIKAATVGLGPRAGFVTTRMLDRWPVEFEDVLLIAQENLKRTLDPDMLAEIDGGPGLLALVSDLIPGSSASLSLESILPDGVTSAVFSVPSMETLLLLPVDAHATVDHLAMLIQTTLSMYAESHDPILDQLFWHRNGSAELIRVLSSDEGDAWRAHIETTPIVQELLRALGEVDPDMMS